MACYRPLDFGIRAEMMGFRAKMRIAEMSWTEFKIQRFHFSNYK